MRFALRPSILLSRSIITMTSPPVALSKDKFVDFTLTEVKRYNHNSQ
jgi:hypothetical protein